MSELTVERLKELLRYDPITGRWTVLRAFGRRKVGQLIPLSKHGHRNCLVIDSRTYRSYRLAWLYMTGTWPLLEIDHINRDFSDDRWDNLREASRTQNEANTKMRRDNRSGAKGVSWHRGKWRARITVNWEQRHLGRFTDLEAARRVYQAAATAAFGDFARHE